MQLRFRKEIFLAVCLSALAIEHHAKAADWQSEWQRVLDAAKKEGTVVAAIPPSQDFRKELESVFQPKFGIVLELVPARGAQNAQRIVSEYKAGDAILISLGRGERDKSNAIPVTFMFFVIAKVRNYHLYSLINAGVGLLQGRGFWNTRHLPDLLNCANPQLSH